MCLHKEEEEEMDCLPVTNVFKVVTCAVMQPVFISYNRCSHLVVGSREQLHGKEHPGIHYNTPVYEMSKKIIELSCRRFCALSRYRTHSVTTVE